MSLPTRYAALQRLARVRAAAPTPTELRLRYLDDVLGYAQRRLGTRDEAEDVAVEVFCAAFLAHKKCPTASPDGSDLVKAWLLGIARHKVLDVLRKRNRRREVSLERVAEQVSHDESDRSTLDALETLRPEWREVLLLKYVEELSLREIGKVMGRSEKSVSSLLQRARAAARETLRESQ